MTDPRQASLPIGELNEPVCLGWSGELDGSDQSRCFGFMIFVVGIVRFTEFLCSEIFRILSDFYSYLLQTYFELCGEFWSLIPS